MYHTIWCYRVAGNKKYTSLKSRFPITRSQAIFIAKRKFNAKNILEMAPCSDIKESLK